MLNLAHRVDTKNSFAPISFTVRSDSYYTLIFAERPRSDAYIAIDDWPPAYTVTLVKSAGLSKIF